MAREGLTWNGQNWNCYRWTKVYTPDLWNWPSRQKNLEFFNIVLQFHFFFFFFLVLMHWLAGKKCAHSKFDWQQWLTWLPLFQLSSEVHCNLRVVINVSFLLYLPIQDGVVGLREKGQELTVKSNCLEESLTVYDT